MMLAYSVSVERGRRHWRRCGTATRNADGTLTIQFTAIPSREVILRDPVHSPEPLPPDRSPAPFAVHTHYCASCGASRGKEGGRPLSDARIMQKLPPQPGALPTRIDIGDECPWCGKVK